jgi:predicted O-methyltransferase YrrM
MTKHLHASGAAAWDASEAVLAFLEETLEPGWRTLETGAGRTTLLFARKGCRHDAVTPSSDEIAAIKAAGAAQGVDLSAVTFHEGFSQDVLPRLSDHELDLVFIDGGHGFPIPAVDFQYLAPRLRVGGMLLIDDVDLWTGDMIVQVLRRDRGWRFEAKLKGRTAVFEKTRPYVAHEWTKQPYVVRKSFWPQTQRKLANGLRLLARGDVAAAARKLDHERRLKEAARQDS